MGKEIIESIRAQRRRIRHAMERRLADPEDDCVLVTSEDDHDDANAFWGPLFQHYFVESHDDSRDDMLFFVKNAVGWGDGRSKSVAASRDNSSDETLADESANDPYFVRRKNGRKALPSPTSARINWEESFYLNLIVNQFEYTLTVAICKQDSSGKLRCLSRVSQRVYGSPSRRQMHMTDKAVETELTYPLIYFTVDNFDDIFGEVFVQQEESLCVELVACTSIITRDVPPSTSSPSLSRSLSATGAAVHSADSSPGGVAHVTHAATPAPSSRPIRSTIFQGQVGFPALRQAYCAKQREGASLLSTRSRMEYLLLRGPGGKGGAQVAMGPTTRSKTTCHAAGEDARRKHIRGTRRRAALTRVLTVVDGF
eukprot:Opistho-2@88007